MASQEQASPRFLDRAHAGQELAIELKRFLHGQQPFILAIPPDGIPVAASIASELGAPLDLILSRRIPAPERVEDSLGAVTPDRTLLVNRSVVSKFELSDDDVERLSIPIWADAQRALQVYRGGRPEPALHGHTVVIVDDSLTTGYTMIAAVASARKLQPNRVVVAVPLATLDGMDRVRGYVDELLSLELIADSLFSMASVDRYYKHYPALTDRDVVFTLRHFWAEPPHEGASELF